MGEKGIDYIFIGYVENFKAYRFYVIEPNEYISVNSVIESRDATFDEKRFTSIPIPKSLMPSSNEDQIGETPSETPTTRRSNRARDLEISKNKKEKYKSLALKARKVLSEEEATSSDSNDEEYAMAVRDFKKFFRRRGKFVRQPHDDKKNFRKVKEDKKEKDDRRCFKCGDPNHFISDCPKHSFSDQKAFVVGCWSDSEDDSKKEEICLMALDNNEVLFDTPYYSSSSLDNESWQNEYDKLCKISLRIINKNKQLKAKNEVLKKEACELKTKVEQLERNKEISLECDLCVNLQSKH
ncbi:zf-CCHC domain-containing protein [Tanacetum coccineum]